MSFAADRVSDTGPGVAPAPIEHAALGRAVLALTRMLDVPDAPYDGEAHWPADGRPSGTGESRERLAHTGERPAWVALDAAEAALAREVSAYVRALRDGGMSSRGVLAAVRAVVREATAPSLGATARQGVEHDAGRYVVQAYFAR